MVEGGGGGGGGVGRSRQNISSRFLKELFYLWFLILLMYFQLQKTLNNAFERICAALLSCNYGFVLFCLCLM